MDITYKIQNIQYITFVVKELLETVLLHLHNKAMEYPLVFCTTNQNKYHNAHNSKITQKSYLGRYVQP